MKPPAAGTSPVRSTPKSPKTEQVVSGWDTSKESIADYSLRKMREAGVPLTRENYLERQFGDRSYQPDAEQELDFPAQFRRLLPPNPTE